ncbi:MAG: MBL fold metallo-hydrolase [Alysiella sp.]|uniref:MBL fold metallo-hydrolase n=1 Tax=Alysiella sp. TaxID=1872483 RepID=UPI0026DB8DDE|nr:MBL fold metallo-hydrolase [Alysiella sp.]MDO4433235.1 MBL fold metallo-hydrolase [Alysiella sp.]
MALNIQIMAVTPFRQNCTLLWCDQTRDAVLIDVGGDVDFVWQQVRDLGVNLQAVWLTHGHLDHAGGVPALLERAVVPVLGPHIEDDFLLQSLPEKTASYGFPVCPAFVPTRYLNESDSMMLGEYRFDVWHIPGHTPGHLVFYCAAQNLLIAGDVLFHESIGRTDFPRSNHQALLEGIRDKLYVLPDETVVLPGHGRTTTIGHEKQHNPFVQP